MSSVNASRRQAGSLYAHQHLPGIDDCLFVTVTLILSPATVYFQHITQADVCDDEVQNRNSELDDLLTLSRRYAKTVQLCTAS